MNKQPENFKYEIIKTIEEKISISVNDAVNENGSVKSQS
jgi:hypothetical protein